MKILQVNVVYDKGSTGKIVRDIHQSLKDYGVDSVVCYGRGTKIKEENIYKTCTETYAHFCKVISMVSGITYGSCLLSTAKLISIIKKEKPDIVHLHCINGNFVNIYSLIKWLKVHNIKTVLTLHAEFMHTGGCAHSKDCNRWSQPGGCTTGKCPRWRTETGSLFYDSTSRMWKKMKKAFEGFQNNLIVVSVSPWLNERAKQSEILRNKINTIVLNGVDTKIFRPYDVTDLRKKHKLSNEKIIFHPTAFFSDDPNHIKGGYFVLQVAERLKKKNIKIFVAGPYVKNLPVPRNVVFLGNISNQKTLAEYYSMADVTLLTSKRETFSMVLAESLCCGTRVVGFEAGGPESIALPQYCSFVKYGDIYGLEENIFESFREPCVNIANDAAEEYSKERMVKQYYEIYKS